MSLTIILSDESCIRESKTTPRYPPARPDEDETGYLFSFETSMDSVESEWRAIREVDILRRMTELSIELRASGR
ncbi:hypothetical protein NL676_023956 [Syzygium grande]|nr:hypothetical protein NL676_023956 [Syzygium grande]